MRSRLLLAFVLVGLAAPCASADLFLYYTETFTDASGSLDNDVNFTGQTVTITMYGDASNVGSSTYQYNGTNIEYTLAGTLTVSVSGGPTDVLTSSDILGVYDNQAPTAASSTAGFADFTSQQVIMATTGSYFSTYDLQSTTPQESGTGLELPSSGFSIPTYNNGTGGSFIVTSASGSDFQTFAVPEPSSVIMTGLAMVLGGAGFFGRKKLGQRRISTVA